MNVVEKWVQVTGTPYEASSLGNVRRDGRILNPRVHSNGYLRVCFSINGVHSDQYIHRLVCEAFHGKPAKGLHADHINGQRNDNRATNLRWLTPHENRKLRDCAAGERNGISKLTDAEVARIKSTQYSRGKYVQLAAEYGVGRNTISRIMKGAGWRHVQ